MTKKELRAVYKEKRLALSATDKLKLDDLLLIQLQRLPLPNNIRVLVSYWPLEHHAEVNTHLFTRYMEHAIPALRVCYPVVDFAAREMKAILVHDETDFVENEQGIPEPEEGDEIDAADIDMIFVPLLAYDTKGYRVGYGKGFYDRFLKKCRTDVLTVGFSYFQPVDNIDDKNQFDVPLSFCIIPEQVYEF